MQRSRDPFHPLYSGSWSNARLAHQTSGKTSSTPPMMMAAFIQPHSGA